MNSGRKMKHICLCENLCVWVCTYTHICVYVVFGVMDWGRSLKEKVYVEEGRERSTKQSAGTLHMLMIGE